jgi:hypothetical protein
MAKWHQASSAGPRTQVCSSKQLHIQLHMRVSFVGDPFRHIGFAVGVGGLKASIASPLAFARVAFHDTFVG